MKSLSLIFLIFLLFSCSKEPLQPWIANENTDQKLLVPLTFSGYKWTIKNSLPDRTGPGGNFFSKKPADVFVDASGYLHLAITKTNNRWYCAEIWSNQNLGYGKYIYVTKGNVEQYDKKIVVGLFTWDDNTYQTQANDELDVEFAKWGNANAQYVMAYSVQPSFGFGVYPERSITPQSHLVYDANGFTTHIIKWHTDRVTMEAHTGDDTTFATLTHTWTFDNTNPPRKANEGGNPSDPVVIPVPGNTTKAHINFWLFDNNGDGKGDPPSNGLNEELVIKRFQFIPD